MWDENVRELLAVSEKRCEGMGCMIKEGRSRKKSLLLNKEALYIFDFSDQKSGEIRGKGRGRVPTWPPKAAEKNDHCAGQTHLLSG